MALPDDYAGNTSTVGTVLVGNKSSGAIELPNDSDWFKVNLTAGTVYLFKLEGANSGAGTLGQNGGTPYLTLHSPGGGFIDSSYTGSPSDEPMMSFTPTSSGTYYLEASELGDDRTGTYRISASLGAADDFADTTSTKGALVVGSSATGTIEQVSDSDWFKVNLTAGTVYLFKLEGANSGAGTLGQNGGTPYLTLHSPSGGFIDSSYTGSPSDEPMMSFTPTSSGTYYLEASELGGDRTGTYRISASAGAADDFADTTSTKGALVVGSSATGTIEQVSDSDWFKVNLTAGTVYLFKLEGANSGAGTLGQNGGTPYLTLHSPSGGFIDSSYTGSPSDEPMMSFTPTSSGTYYLEASELGGDRTGTYRISASAGAADDFADTTSTKGALVVGSSATGTIEQVSDSDWFKVNLTAGTVYLFKLEGANSGAGTLGQNGGTPYLTLHSPSGGFIDSSYTGSPSDEPMMSFTPTSSGTYYLEASELGGDRTGTYRISASAGAADDFADTTSTKGALVVGSSATGTIEQVSDSDWFKVNLTAGTVYLFKLEGANSGAGTLGQNGGTPYLTLHSPGGGFIDSSYTGSPSDEPMMSFTPTSSGTYYLEASELGGDRTGTYRISAIGTQESTATGTAASDDLRGTSANDSMFALAGNDVLTGAGGDDKLDGGAGIDTATYVGSRSGFTVEKRGTSIAVTDSSGNEGKDVLSEVERIRFKDISLAFDLDDNAGDIYRLYQAGFNRKPDSEGLGFWLKAVDDGMSLRDVASQFMASPEFRGLYGENPSKASFLSQIYENILHRAPDQAGYDWWLNVLEQGGDLAGTLVGFSDSPENQALVIGSISAGIVFVPFG